VPNATMRKETLNVHAKELHHLVYFPCHFRHACACYLPIFLVLDEETQKFEVALSGGRRYTVHECL